MLLRTLMAMAVGCLTLLAQESTPTSDLTPAADPATAATTTDKTASSSGQPLTRSTSDTYLEAYTFKTADSGQITKTLMALQLPGVQIDRDEAQARRILVRATESQHSEVASLIRKLDAPAPPQPTADKPDPAPSKRRFKVTIALIRND